MKLSQTGEFYGQTNTTIKLEGLTLTHTVYTHDKVDWHYHENAYFTFIPREMLLRGIKRKYIIALPAVYCSTIGRTHIIISNRKDSREASILK